MLCLFQLAVEMIHEKMFLLILFLVPTVKPNHILYHPKIFIHTKSRKRKKYSYM